MNKRILKIFVLLVAITATAGAEMYRCELSDGRVIYGDKPVNLSDACQPVKSDPSKGYLSIEQPAPRKSITSSPVATEPTPASETATGAQVDLWTARATTLVESYNDARKRRIRESYLVNKRKAMQEMAAINLEKKAMLQELQDSSLSQQEQDDIRQVLAEIPEDAP